MNRCSVFVHTHITSLCNFQLTANEPFSWPVLLTQCWDIQACLQCISAFYGAFAPRCVFGCSIRASVQYGTQVCEVPRLVTSFCAFMQLSPLPLSAPTTTSRRGIPVQPVTTVAQPERRTRELKHGGTGAASVFILRIAAASTVGCVESVPQNAAAMLQLVTLYGLLCRLWPRRKDSRQLPTHGVLCR